MNVDRLPDDPRPDAAIPAPTPAIPAPTPAIPAPTPTIPAPTPTIPAPTSTIPAPTPNPPDQRTLLHQKTRPHPTRSTIHAPNGHRSMNGSLTKNSGRTKDRNRRASTPQSPLPPKPTPPPTPPTPPNPAAAKNTPPRPRTTPTIGRSVRENQQGKPDQKRTRTHSTRMRATSTGGARMAIPSNLAAKQLKLLTGRRNRSAPSTSATFSPVLTRLTPKARPLTSYTQLIRKVRSGQPAAPYFTTHF